MGQLQPDPTPGDENRVLAEKTPAPRREPKAFTPHGEEKLGGLLVGQGRGLRSHPWVLSVQRQKGSASLPFSRRKGMGRRRGAFRRKRRKKGKYSLRWGKMGGGVQ